MTGTRCRGRIQDLENNDTKRSTAEMGDVKNIALIINASNFERQKATIKAAHRSLKQRGGYALYVFLNY